MKSYNKNKIKELSFKYKKNLKFLKLNKIILTFNFMLLV